MWLLDINVPAQVGPVLRELGVAYAFAANRGWGKLTNGALVRAAAEAGFLCILTKDVRFEDSARASLRLHKTVSIVHLALPQAPGRAYADSFRRAWAASPIKPVPGELVVWP